METKPTLFKSRKFKDNRGFFEPTKIIGLKNVHQSNRSYSFYGVIRGMHRQLAPYEQNKQLLVCSGTIEDVIINSLDGHVESFILEEGDGIIVPCSYYHGFEVLSRKGAKIQYFVDNTYSPVSESTMNPLSIPHKWKTRKQILSEKDKLGMDYAEFMKSIRIL